jgi:hypothetical protein
MKYINIFSVSITTSIIGIFIFSCEPSPKRVVNPVPYHIVKAADRQYQVKEYVIDSCQYIGDLHFDTRSRYLTHKGNCSNPRHLK